MVTTARAINAALIGAMISLAAATPVAAQELVVLNNRIPAPSLAGAGPWHNTAEPLDLPDLRGKFVILDFWTYCCINCLHVLPELKQLEEEFPEHLVVIGVHSPKFANERDPQNVLQAIERYEVKHPVVCDSQQALWNKYRVTVWPSLRIIDPEGKLVAHQQGEFKAEMLAAFLRKAIPIYRRNKLLDETPLAFDVARPRQPDKPLRYPGKILADAASQRLFISDSGHHRIVVAKLTGEVLEVIGAGASGREDGPFEQATFNHPQGLALQGETLYVADTENHLLRKIDLKERRVTTLAGTGEQVREPPMRSVQRPLGVKLASPWDLWLQDDDLYIAMAGTHQIWLMSLTTGSIGPYAGNVVEDIVDGPLLPRTIALLGYASFAQPSGLASDGVNLFVADSEGSSIRAVPMHAGKGVATLLGTAALPQQQRLFTFGDRDGPVQQALLQHPLGLAYRSGKLYIADTYNSKIKELDLQQGAVRTIAGGAGAGNRLLEPGGLSLAGEQLFIADTNQHAIRYLDLTADAPLKTLELKGLQPPSITAQPGTPSSAAPSGKRLTFKAATIKPNAGTLQVAIDLELPANVKLSPDAPLRYYVHADKESPLAPAVTGKWQEVAAPQSPLTIELPLQASATGGPLTISLGFYYCTTTSTSICRVGEVTWTGRLTLDPTAPTDRLELQYAVGK